MPPHNTKVIALQFWTDLKRRVVSPLVFILALVLIVALALGATGLDHGLPYFPKADEYRFVTIAGGMAALNSPNPGWFGHPGSTLLYPLALVYKLWGSASYQIPVWQRNPDLAALLEQDPGASEHFETRWTTYYLIGRWLNVLFFMVGIVVTYLVGMQTWDKRVALLAAWFMAVTPILLDSAQVVRTDHAGLLFFMLGF